MEEIILFNDESISPTPGTAANQQIILNAEEDVSNPEFHDLLKQWDLDGLEPYLKRKFNF